MLTVVVPLAPEASENESDTILRSPWFPAAVTEISRLPVPDDGETVSQSPVTDVFQDLESVVRVSTCVPPPAGKFREAGLVENETEEGV